MHLPRRFRRRLLLPPGWVALGFLLLLACLALQTHWRQLRPERVMQLTMPRWQGETDSLQLAFYRQDSAQQVARGLWDYNPFTHLEDKHATAQLARMRPWHTFALTEAPAANLRSLAAIEAAVQAIQADTTHAGGVRIRMAKRASYTELVALLAMMCRLNQKRYWLDIQHQPTTF